MSRAFVKKPEGDAVVLDRPLRQGKEIADTGLWCRPVGDLEIESIAIHYME